MRHGLLRLSLLAGVSLGMLPASAHAAGFYLQEQSVSGLGTAFAGAAADTQDASTVYYNPAGMTGLTRPEIYFGVTLLNPHADFDNDGSTYTRPAGLGGTTSPLTGDDSGNPFDHEILPQLYGVLPVNDRLSLGLGINSPFGLADQYDEESIGRYNSTDSELMSVDIQPTAAYKVNDWLSVGAGVNIEYVYANLKSRIPAPSLGTPNPASDGDLRLKGDDWEVGYNLGLQFKPTATTKIGVTYKTAINHDLEGQVDITNPQSVFLGGLSGVSTSATGFAKLSQPDIASVAVAQQLDEKWTVLGSVNYYGWSHFDNIPARSAALPGGSTEATQNYDNTFGFAVGARYRMSDQWLLKAGFQYDQTPTVTSARSTRVPDGDRMWFAAGATYSVTPQIDLDLSGAFVNVKEERIDVTDTFTTGSVNTRGDSDGNVGILAAAIRYKF